jgi:hypothetical protein
MKALAGMAVADLRRLIRDDPTARAAAWEEIKFRNQSRQAFERENGVRPEKVFKHISRIEVAGHEITVFEGGGPPSVERWFPPDLSDPTPPPND